jgi:hypothetical protein
MIPKCNHVFFKIIDNLTPESKKFYIQSFKNTFFYPIKNFKLYIVNNLFDSL